MSEDRLKEAGNAQHFRPYLYIVSKIFFFRSMAYKDTLFTNSK
jgi:hypothetical protein